MVLEVLHHQQTVRFSQCLTKNFCCMRLDDVIQSFKDSFAPLRQVDPLNFSEVVTWSEILQETGSKTFKTYRLLNYHATSPRYKASVSPPLLPHPIPLVSHP